MELFFIKITIGSSPGLLWEKKGYILKLKIKVRAMIVIGDFFSGLSVSNEEEWLFRNSQVCNCHAREEALGQSTLSCKDIQNFLGLQVCPVGSFLRDNRDELIVSRSPAAALATGNPAEYCRLAGLMKFIPGHS